MAGLRPQQLVVLSCLSAREVVKKSSRHLLIQRFVEVESVEYPVERIEMSIHEKLEVLRIIAGQSCTYPLVSVKREHNHIEDRKSNAMGPPSF